MPYRTSPVWLEEQQKAFRAAKENKIVYSVVVNSPQPIKSICFWLATNQIPYKVVPLGGGVKKVTNDVRTCPKCGGVGRC